MKYQKPKIITYTEEEIAAIVGPAQMGSGGGLDGLDEYLDQQG